MSNLINNPVKGPDGDVVYPLYVSFIEKFAIPNVELINFLIPWGELFSKSRTYSWHINKRYQEKLKGLSLLEFKAQAF